jgi:hypothetical protein
MFAPSCSCSHMSPPCLFGGVIQTRQAKARALRRRPLARFGERTGTTSIYETIPSHARRSVSNLTGGAGTNPVHKRALGACRRDTCCVSFRQQGSESLMLRVLEERTPRTVTRQLCAALHEVDNCNGDEMRAIKHSDNAWVLPWLQRLQVTDR